MTHRTPKVSLTLAAFNSGDYLVDCLESVRAQSFRDFEFIAVDDGSLDQTRVILEEFAASDDRVRLILKDRNEGLSVARNQAVAAARGEYVAFLDADDICHPDMLSSAVRVAGESGAELVIWDYAAFENCKDIPVALKKPSALINMDPSDRRAVLSRPAFAWTKLVRRELLTRLAVEFPRGLTYQDMLVHWQLATQAGRIAFVPERLVYYRQHAQAVTSGTGIRRADYFAVLDLIEAFLRKSDTYAAYWDVLVAKQLDAWHGVYDVVASQHRKTVLAMIKKRFSLTHREYVLSGRPLRWPARQFYLAMLGRRTSGLALQVWKGLRKVRRSFKYKA